MKKRVLAALALVFCTQQALAQDGSLPAQQFAPAPGGDNNYVTVQGTGVLPGFMPAVGLYLNYAHDPLILRRVDTTEQISLIEHHLQLDLIAAIGLFDVLEFGLDLPLTVYQTSGPATDTLKPQAINAFTAGDLRLYVPKWSIYDDPEGFGAALLAVVTLPTGSPDNLQGNKTVTFEPRAVLGYHFVENFRLSLSAGLIIREKQKLYNIDLGNELTFGAGLEYRFEEPKLAIIAEAYGKFSIESDTQAEERPVEVALAARWWAADQHALTLGVARGLTDGYGSPDFRVFLGYNFTPREDGDPDRDGIKGKADACPDDPEDFDGFEDENGCPDRDNDKDRVLDTRDGAPGAGGFGVCMNDPEDIDGFQDDDGCPDPDNDNDKILDKDDKCPNEAEDMDAFQDEDGCPDPDNDNDGVPDVKDGAVGENGFGACMNDPEDIDKFQDEDGCPDPDNDGDGILDVNDDCPDDPTNACRVVVKGKCEIQILDKIEFKYDRDEIDETKSKPILDAVAEVLNKYDWIKLVEVQGHTDGDGTVAYNQDLSQRRAAAVKTYLTTKAKVTASRLTPKGYGKGKPIDTNGTPAGRAKNRRVQFFILDPSQENCKQ